MIPILYESTETEFKTNGIGRLSDAVSCVVTEERNGAFELELKYPIDGIHYGEIEGLRIVAAIPSDGKAAQPFVIYEISKPLNGIVTVRGEHISYRLKSIPVLPFSSSSLAGALSGLVSNSAIDNPFVFSTDISSSAGFSNDVPTSCRSLLAGQDESIVDVYGGEWEFDGFSCRLWKSRGSNNGVRIAYGKNLTDLKQEEKLSDTYTGILPYWKKEQEDNVTIIYATNKILYAENHESYPYEKIEAVDMSSSLKEDTIESTEPTEGSAGEWTPTGADVLNAGLQYIKDNGVGVPDVSLDVSFVSLADTEEYKDLQSENISLCDTVTVDFPRLGVYSTAQVIKTEYDVLTERYNKIELGSEKQTLSGDIRAYINGVRKQLDERIEANRGVVVSITYTLKENSDETLTVTANGVKIDASAYTLKKKTSSGWVDVTFSALANGDQIKAVIGTEETNIITYKALIKIQSVTKQYTQSTRTLTAAVSPSGATVKYEWLWCKMQSGTYHVDTTKTTASVTLTTEEAALNWEVRVTGTGNYTGTAMSNNVTVGTTYKTSDLALSVNRSSDSSGYRLTLIGMPQELNDQATYQWQYKTAGSSNAYKNCGETGNKTQSFVAGNGKLDFRCVVAPKSGSTTLTGDTLYIVSLYQA